MPLLLPLPLPLPPFCSGDPVGWRPEERPTWCVSAVVTSIWRLFWVASPMPMGTARFLRLPSSGAGRQDRQTSTPRPNANKAKRLPRQPSNHSVRADAANNNKNTNGGRRPTESSRTGAGAGAHQKMTAPPNCLIRALLLLQCCSAARLSRWPVLQIRHRPTHGLRFLWGGLVQPLTGNKRNFGSGQISLR